jgi:hypothetical protein
MITEKDRVPMLHEAPHLEEILAALFSWPLTWKVW